MGDRTNLPDRTPHSRRDSGYRKCPSCGERHQRAGIPRADARERQNYLRALVPGDMKVALIERSRREGLSISGLVRTMVRFYLATHP